MTEYEYETTATLAHVRDALQALRGCFSAREDPIENREIVTAISALQRLEDRLYARIDTMMGVGDNNANK